MPLATSTSTLPHIFMTSLSQCGEDNSNVSLCLDHLYIPHGRYSRLFGRKLRCFGKGVMLRAGRATTCYLRKATLGAQAIAVVTKIWKIWDGFHKELYLYGHPLHLRPLQGLCVPSIIGVFSTSEGLANMAMELPHPHSWRIADRSLSTDEKRAIVDAYAQIHARGVLHGDVALRHILIGKDGKPTIINFRRASCLRPAMKIGLGSCSTHEFQLEMRQVKFLLDYEGAREFEYQLARRCRSATGMNAREGPTLVTPVVRLKTCPHLHFPFTFLALQTSRYIPYPGFRAICRCGRTSGQSPPFTAPSSSCLKGKQPEHDGNSDVVDNAPIHKHKRFCQTSSPTRAEGEFSDPGHLMLDSEQERHVAGTSLTPWNHFELNTNTADLEPGLSVAPGTAAHSPNNFPMLPSLSYPSQDGAVLPNQLPSSLPLSYDIECFLPSWVPVSLTPSHAPIPDLASYTPHFSCPVEEPMALYETLENFDCASDLPSDTSDSTTHTSFVWVDSEPSSPEVFITLHDEFPPCPTIDNSDVPLLFDSPSVANAEVTGGSLEPVPTYYKRKRLFVPEEDEYGERARKQPRIEL
ncbi:hypothetical protein F5888DRAFT_1646516 [Russula emetica]|nr:hypothetical protein F5888DRAFT_1646516 [Russula emetica]